MASIDVFMECFFLDPFFFLFSHEVLLLLNFHQLGKHKKEDLALDQLMQHLHIEEETRNREKEPAKETIVKAHVVVDKDEKKNSGRHNQNKFLKPKNSKGFKPSSLNPKAKNNECYNCHKIGHFAKDCYQLKHGSDKMKNRKEFYYFDTLALDLGEADVILGIKIIRSQHGIVLTQSSYIEKILRRFIDES
ncbi:hypothetical protein RJ639_028310 [Escallonia herrerae]|uniref:CCHC-type domain-containing protein n=1 Tax=Escallonia herrerae TaxID=1293975 RepID=A0AA88X2J0_9ASTE|nr:hypothetical protein RJ639_028310 [Escallonia herrerae]